MVDTPIDKGWLCLGLDNCLLWSWRVLIEDLMDIADELQECQISVLHDRAHVELRLSVDLWVYNSCHNLDYGRALWKNRG